jgi:autotransporter-associated beta strand protein
MIKTCPRITRASWKCGWQLLTGVVIVLYFFAVAMADVIDIPIVSDTRIDSRYDDDNYGGDTEIKLVKNAGPPYGDASMVRGLIGLPALPDLSATTIVSAKIWLCLTYDYEANPYARGVTLYPLTQSFDPNAASWNDSTGSTAWSSPGGSYDASNSVPWTPATDIQGSTSGYNNGHWWCSWDVTSLWNNSNLRNNGALLMLDPETPPATGWITKVFASSEYGDSDSGTDVYRPYLELTTTQVQPLNRWNNLNGNWHSAANWSAGSIPDGKDAVASFLDNATQNHVVTLDAPVTVGTITLDSATQKYTLSGAGSNDITLSASSGHAAITDSRGSHEIAAPLVLVSDTTVTVASASDTLTLDGAISGTGTGLTKEGAGVLALLGSNTYSGDTIVDAGTLKALAISGSGSTTVAGGAMLRVNYIAQHQLSVGAGGAVILGGVTAAAGTANFSGAAGSDSVGGVCVGGDVAAVSVPEPRTMVLLGAVTLWLAAVGLGRRRMLWQRAFPEIHTRAIGPHH